MLKYNFLTNSFEKDLLEIREIINKNIGRSDRNPRKLLIASNPSGGKLLRALFVLIGGSFSSLNKEKLKNTAAAVELLHLATLVHDDIVDDSNIRRGNVTLHKSFAIKTALFTGDYLYAESYVIFSQNTSPQSLKAVSETIKTICSGEINQFFSSYSYRGSVKDYLKRINGKCASLFSLSLSIGALQDSNNIILARKLKRIGHYIGMAFQIIDDILDITSPEEVLGKPSGSDLRQGIYTLPVLYEIKNGNTVLSNLIDEGNIDEALLLLRQCKGLEKARNLAEKYTYKSLRLIEELPNTEGRAVLQGLAEKMLLREY